MFSGIIGCVAPLVSGELQDHGLCLTVATGWDDLALGESVAVNGVCLTVATVGDHGRGTFFASVETLARSNLGAATPGCLFNLERAVTSHTRLSGHLVQGHVDGKATIAGITQQGSAHRLRVAIPVDLRRFCVPKGSIALDGVSLTINGFTESMTGEAWFEIDLTLIPHSWANTIFFQRRVGDSLNVEVDVIGKYVEQLCRAYLSPSIA